MRNLLPSVAAALLATAAPTAEAQSTARFYFPLGVAVDANGNVYVADEGNSTIRKVTPGGVVTTLAGSAQLYYPFSVAVDASGNVFVAEPYIDTIRKVNPAGVVTTIGGAPGAASSTDGIGSAARFSSPYGLAVSAAGTLFVADRDNNRIAQGALTSELGVMAWRQRYFGTLSGSGIAGDLADPDGDGLANLVEFAVGADPAQGVSPSQLPVPQLIDGNFVLSLAQPAVVSGITYGAEWSSTLGGGAWNPISDTGSGGTHVFSIPANTAPTLFLRLKITNP